MGESTGTGTDTSIYVGQRAASLTVSPQFEAITMVRVFVDDNNVYQAGTETGRVLEVDCPYGTQEMANIMLSQVEGFQYQPMTATDALADPALELGDAVNVGGVLATAVQTAITFDAMMAMDISAPGQEEIESEYPYVSKQVSQFNHDLAETRSLIAKTSEEILLQVSGQFDTVEDAISSIQINVDQINLRVEGVDTEMEELGTQVSEISLKMDSLTLSVSNDKTSSTLKLMAGSAQLSSAKITFTGVVTFDSLSTKGATEINGANITTGKISADRIDVANLLVTKVYNQLKTRVLLESSSAEWVYLGGDSAGTYQFGRTYIKGDIVVLGPSDQFTGLAIYTTGGDYYVTAPTYWTWRGPRNATNSRLGDFYISDLTCSNISCDYDGEFNRVKVGDTSSYYLGYNSGYLTYNGHRIAYSSDSGGIVDGFAGNTLYFGGSSSAYYIYAGGRTLRPNLGPTSSTRYSLGTSSYYWHNVYLGSNYAKIGYNASSQIGFYAASPIERQTLSTTYNNQNYTSANANNYLYILNNIAGILKKLGLIG